jgi:hypothetical protein
MFADFRIANSQGTAVSRLPNEKTHNHTVKDPIFAYTTNPNLNNHRLQRIGLPGQRRTPTLLMESVPPFRGMRKVADSHRESTENSRIFDILSLPQSLLDARAHLSVAAVCDRRFRALNPHPSSLSLSHLLITYFTFRAGG